MANFCSNCGAGLSGKFCSECGAPDTPTSDTTQDVANNLTDVNGVMVDLNALVSRHGSNYTGKIEAIKELRNLTNISLREGKQIIDAACEGHPSSTKPAQKKGVWARAMEQAEEQNRQKVEEKQKLKERIAQMDRDGIAYCPKCYSSSLSAHKKGFGIGKAVVGAAFLPLGLVAGNIGAKKVRVTCLKCGHQFMAGKK